MNPLFHQLFDDAAIFPPGDVPLPAAVAAHRERAASPLAPLLGPFVCPAARWDELVAAAGAGPPLRVSLILREPGERIPSAAGIEVAAVEAPAGALMLGHHGTPCHAYHEMPVGEISVPRLAALRDAGVRLKIRTGGVRAEAFPPVSSLAAAIVAAVRADIGFKLTAGLHDPIRHRDPMTGFEHHGFLNVILAVARALQGHDAAQALADADGARVATAVSRIGAGTAAAVRRHFTGFGTCSITEPVDGLIRYGLLEDPR
ncbi:hypothetical protein [Actinoplanes rectilineatus]|uniref:hypothetical protein n=1 Tax=Actinoplanes rectilineatus TaxID=113571 RepID=UPI0005F2FCA3|nr:hypothetical protein [Actinoplanes rectilineatus]